jgi:hypothetical protein
VVARPSVIEQAITSRWIRRSCVCTDVTAVMSAPSREQGSSNEWPAARSRAELITGTCALPKRHNASMRVERARENVFTVTATSQELSALVAGARMALEAMRAAPEPPPAEAVEILERVLGDFDRARERLTDGGG